jgi:imidazole glycerol phosphate synthase subunit HisF
MAEIKEWPIVARPIPKPPNPKLMTDPEERASFYALSNADEVMRLSMTIAYAEGPSAALDAIENAAEAVRRQFKK